MSGGAESLTDAQFKIARLYGFASWPKLKAHVDSLEEIGQLKQAIDSNDLERVKFLMTRNPALHRAPLGYGKNGPLTWVAECRVPWAPPSAERLGNPGERTIFSVAERSTMQGWIACHEELDALEIVAIDGLLELADFLQGIDVGLEFRPTGKPLETCDFELRVGKRFRATRHEKIF